MWAWIDSTDAIGGWASAERSSEPATGAPAASSSVRNALSVRASPRAAWASRIAFTVENVCNRDRKLVAQRAHAKIDWRGKIVVGAHGFAVLPFFVNV